MSRFLIPLGDYNRIYQVAHGVLEDVANVERACIFFASLGGYILNTQYNIPCRVVAGAFGLCVSDKPDVAFFGKAEDGFVGGAASDGFHMWVQTQTHVIDFMAPIFPEVFGALRPDLKIPRRMFQREIRTETTNANDLAAPGDFITYPDMELTGELVDNFIGRASNTDLINVAEAWFGSRRGKQKQTFAMINDRGKIHELSLPRSVATGAW